MVTLIEFTQCSGLSTTHTCATVVLSFLLSRPVGMVANPLRAVFVCTDEVAFRDRIVCSREFLLRKLRVGLEE